MNITLPYPPSVNAMWRSVVIGGRGVVLLTKEARAYKKRVAERCVQAGLIPLRGEVEVFIAAYRPRKAGDLDGTLKCALDALQGFTYLNDSQIVALHAYRYDDKADPRLEVTVTPRVV